MEKLFCFRCCKESEHSEYDPCPHCGGGGPWGRPVEDSAASDEEKGKPAPGEERSPSLANASPEAIERLFEKLVMAPDAAPSKRLAKNY